MTLVRCLKPLAPARVFCGLLPRAGEWGRRVLQVVVLLSSALALHGAVPGVSDEPAVLTNVLQLRQAVWADQWARQAVRLDALVLWHSLGQLFLQDDSGSAQVQMILPGESSRLTGYRVHLEGWCVAGRGSIREAVVDNDGLHRMIELSGSAFLTAGRHPLRVDWFNGSAGLGLRIDYKGPGVPRRKIPATALFRPGSTGGEWLPGLEYRCYEGAWDRLPDFQKLQPVKSGSVGDFDLQVRTRDNQVGLQFRGYLEVPRAGVYTFWTRSDDGSRLFIEDPFLTVRKLSAAPVPFPAPGAILPGQRLGPGQEDRWSEVEGTVNFASEQAGEVELELGANSGRMRVELAEPAEGRLPLLLEGRVRLTGVCRSTYAAEGQPTAGELLVPGWRQCQVLEVAGTRWSQYPVVPIGQLSATNQNEQLLAHIRGKVSSDEPLVVADETGQLLLETSQAVARNVSERVEAFGYCSRRGTNLVLRGVCRPLSEKPAAATDELPLLMTAEQVKRLDRTEAARGYPVKLRGVVIGLGPSGGFALQDSTRAVHILPLAAGRMPRPRVGEFWEIDGKTSVGFAPQVRAERARCLGSGSLPEPLRPTWDQLSNGSLEMQYVEVQGILITVAAEGAVFLTRSGQIKIQFPDLGRETLEHYQNALTRVRGCISPAYEAQTHRAKVGEIRLFSAQFEVEESAPVDPFAAPLKHPDELLLYDPEAGAMQRVRLAGQVLHQRNGEFYLVDHGMGVRFQPRSAVALEVGDLAEVAGYVDLSGSAPVLREAAARRTGHTHLPPAQTLAETNCLNGRYDATLVRLVARLQSASGNRGEATLSLQAGTREFLARCNTSRQPLPPMVPGSRLELTGVYAGQGGNRRLGREIDAFELLVNSPADIRVLERPSWWTVAHALTVVGGMACAMAGALVWIALLRRQVDERSRQLAVEVRRHEQAERQHALDKDRARIARDLHDDLGACLTEIGLLAQAGSGASPTLEKASQRFRAIRDKAAQTVNALDVIVWLINPRKDTLASLATYFASYAEEYLSASGIACHLKIPLDLPPLPLTTEMRQGLFLALKEALNNVVRHSRARQVEIEATLEQEWLQITVTDNGCGFDPSGPAEGNGLANFRERLGALGGQCQVRSLPGAGTVIALRVPVSLQTYEL